jgi:hypothetical protein
MLKLLLTTVPQSAWLNTSVNAPAVLIDRSLNVATPADAATVKVPESVPLPVLIATVIFPVAFVSTAPPLSLISTVMAGLIVVLVLAFVGCWVIVRWPATVSTTTSPRPPDG